MDEEVQERNFVSLRRKNRDDLLARQPKTTKSDQVKKEQVHKKPRSTCSKNKKVKGDLKVCGNVDIKGDASINGKLTVCTESNFTSSFGTDFINETIASPQCSNSFQGWWAKLDKGAVYGFGSDYQTGANISSSDIDAYIYIDTTVTPIKVTTWGGNGKDVRAPQPNEVADRPFYYQKDEKTLLSILPIDPGDDYTKLYSNAYDSLTLQDDGTLVAATDQGTPSVSTGTIRPTGTLEFTFYGIYQKISALQLPQPMPMYDALDYRGTDYTLPTNLFKYVFDKLVYYGIAKGGKDTGIPSDDWNPDFIGYQDAYGLFNQYISTGKTYESVIVKTKTTKNNSGMTNIFTDSFHYATPGSTVTLQGFSDGWVAANGTYVNGSSVHTFGGIPNPNPLFVDVESPDNVGQGSWKHHFYLRLDTSDFPQYQNNNGYPNNADGTADESFWGNSVAKVSVTHRVTDDMEYPAFIAAVMAFFYDAFKVSQHAGISSWVSSLQRKFVADTWLDVQNLLNANIARAAAFRSRTNRFECSSLFQNGAIKFPYNPNGPTLAIYPWDYNDAYGMLPTPGSIFDYNVDAQNYLVGVSNLYYTLDGIPYLPQHFIAGELGYLNMSQTTDGGAYFVSTVAPMNFDDVDAGNPNPNIWTLLGSDVKPNTRVAANCFFFGFVDPQLTQGKKIGYIYTENTSLVDGNFLMFVIQFTKAEDQDSPRGAMEGYAGVLAPMMTYLNTQHPLGPGLDSIIYDNRNNSGGTATQNYVMGSLFGAKRHINDGKMAFWRDNGKRVPQNYVADLNLKPYNDIWKLYDEMAAYNYSDQTESRYGSNAVFKNGKVVVLQGSDAASGGDMIFYESFLGEDKTKNLGNGVTCKYLGSCDGRLKGGGVFGYCDAMPKQKYSERLYNSGGNPVSGIPLMRIDNTMIGAPESFNGLKKSVQNPEIAMDQAPGLSGLAGNNPLPEDFEHTYYIGFGYMQPYPYPALPGWAVLHGTEQPDPNDNTTWRDPWLEEAIKEASL